MMYADLYQYLIQHKELPVPGIGTFLLERRPATIDFPNKKINPPSYAVQLQQASYVPGQRFFSWLASARGISDREAVFRFNDFAFDMKKQVSEGAVINWDGIGTLNKGFAGEIKFTPSLPELIFERPVAAEKAIREKAPHMIRVGEDQKTSVEMTALLNPDEEKKTYWWAYALGLALLAIMFLGWHFSEYGVDISSTANGQKLIPAEAPASYKVLP